MFERLGISQAVLEKSIVPKAVTMLDSIDGKAIVRIPTGAAFVQRFKYPYVVLHRVDLHRVLLEACKAIQTIELLPTTKVNGFEDNGDKVRLFTTNTTIEGAAIIAADGLRSIVRQQLLNEGEPRMVGYVAHRTIIPMAQLNADVRREESVLWSGPGYHLVHYPLRDFALFNMVAVFKTPTYADRGDAADYRAEVDRTYRDSHPAMKALIAMTDVGGRWAISDRDPIRHWALVVSPCSAMQLTQRLQLARQGACIAIEDAVCLTELIDRSRETLSAFQQYSKARYIRTARVNTSRALCGTTFITSTICP